MANIYRTARGDAVDIDMVRLANESTIAIGNARTNARGDELGPGGKVVKTRAQIMQDYHKLNTPVPQDDFIGESPYIQSGITVEQSSMDNIATPIPVEQPIAESIQDPAINVESDQSSQYVKPRGSFADAVAKETEVNQELLDPAPLRNKSQGISRI